jgi:hypothetical protein
MEMKVENLASMVENKLLARLLIISLANIPIARDLFPNSKGSIVIL